jgi:CubicO group peptidase (beta-lactamase class C family)
MNISKLSGLLVLILIGFLASEDAFAGSITYQQGQGILLDSLALRSNSSTLYNLVDSKMTSLLQEYKTAGAAVVFIQNGYIVKEGYYGIANIKKVIDAYGNSSLQTVPMSNGTQFCAASCTKPLSAYLLLKMKDYQGKTVFTDLNAAIDMVTIKDSGKKDVLGNKLYNIIPVQTNNKFFKADWHITNTLSNYYTKNNAITICTWINGKFKDPETGIEYSHVDTNQPGAGSLPINLGTLINHRSGITGCNIVSCPRDNIPSITDYLNGKGTVFTVFDTNKASFSKETDPRYSTYWQLGDKYDKYSNANYAIMEKIMQNNLPSGVSFENYMNSFIFNELNMTNSTFSLDMADNLARPFKWWSSIDSNSQEYTDSNFDGNNDYITNVPGSMAESGLYTTPMDYAYFVMSIMNDLSYTKFILPIKMATLSKGVNGRKLCENSKALTGWPYYEKKDRNGTFYWYSGLWQGWATLMSLDSKGNGLVVMTNTGESENINGNGLCLEIRDAWMATFCTDPL